MRKKKTYLPFFIGFLFGQYTAWLPDVTLNVSKIPERFSCCVTFFMYVEIVLYKFKRVMSSTLVFTGREADEHSSLCIVCGV